MEHLFVTISCSCGAILWKQYHEKLTGEGFTEFIRQHFPKTLENSSDIEEKLLLQYDDPSQILHLTKLATQ